MERWDVTVIGAGVEGSAVARELSRYDLAVCVLEKELDVACGNSGRNTGMLHAGFTYFVPSSGILDPMEYTIALAENACQNGVKFFFDRKVTAIERDEEADAYRISAETAQGTETFSTKWVVNCAGMYASQISEMLGYPNYPVRGFKGEYFVLDKKAGAFLKIPVYPALKRFYDMTLEEQKAAIEADPNYGEIVCRCETVTRAEILRAIHNPLGVHTVTGIKNRTRATMGRCQGCYCETRITEMIEQELGVDPVDVRFSKEGSWMFTGAVRKDPTATNANADGEDVTER